LLTIRAKQLTFHARLGPQQRKIVALAFFGGLTHAEISQAVVTAKTEIERIREQVQNIE
jgi:DNA-directed RNA polymerase specialized sigma24 family protein